MRQFAGNHPDEKRLFKEIVGDTNYDSGFNVAGFIEDLYGVGKAPGVYSETHKIHNMLSGYSGHIGKYFNSDIFPAYNTVNVGALSPKYAVSSDDKYMRTISFSGDITPENEAALMEIDSFLEKSNVYGELEKLLGDFDYKKLDVRLDKGMKPNVMGMTDCRGAQPYCDILLNEKLYSKPYTKVGDKNAQMLVKYLQAGTLRHEWVHERTISSPKGSMAVENLLKMGYSKENVRGFLEMLAEMYTIKSLENAGQYALAHIGKMYSPYRDAYKMGERIEREFRDEYGRTGLKGFIYDLWRGELSYTDAQKYIGPLKVKAPEAARYHNEKWYGSGCSANSCNGHEIQYRCT